MERRSLSSLTYKGSIPEAINEAKKQKKLFVVYISGEDTESNNLENTTWTDLKVAESVSKYCILLHIREGSTDATNYCAIYPQNSIPCISAIGYNGLQVWRSGFVSAEVLASSLEKAWFSLHIQETTASVLTAALASNKSEPPTSGTSGGGSPDQGSSSGAAIPSPSPSLEKHLQSSKAKSSVTSEMKNNTEVGVKTSSKSCSDSQSGSVGDECSSSSSKGADNSLSPAAADPEISQAESMPISTANSPASRSIVDKHSGSFSKGADNLLSPAAADPEISQAEQKPSRAANSSTSSDCHSSLPAGGPTVTPSEADELREDERADDIGHGKVDLSGCSGRELSDVHLNIRLPNGVSLREKFTLTSALRVVKDYVDRNQTGLSSYDLAIPYPRKIFTNEDLSKSLSDLSLFNRQALIVVPRQRASGYQGGGSSMSEQTRYRTVADSSSESEGGYFAYVRRLLSYVNPLSYFSGGAYSSPGQDAQRGIWEYGPNPTLQNNLAARGDGPNPSSNPSTSVRRNESKNRPPTTSHFGSNIHTLKHDEDDSRFNDRNAFWNGNSTQYGGDNNGR
ncbi:plant UBX domain-containing protein 11 isoform X2 [Citrus sinensis]|uniref:plant UBX domain-containing protein 11 isoform X2 n=1 Tax=Citrus sinensis TaxID=2711 RepID=UPI002277DE22|nr:plant UBX domain-containing protein 11 isoform X2 [Citrus sinensis]